MTIQMATVVYDRASEAVGQSRPTKYANDLKRKGLQKQASILERLIELRRNRAGFDMVRTASYMATFGTNEEITDFVDHLNSIYRSDRNYVTQQVERMEIISAYAASRRTATTQDAKRSEQKQETQIEIEQETETMEYNMDFNQNGNGHDENPIQDVAHALAKLLVLSKKPEPVLNPEQIRDMVTEVVKQEIERHTKTLRIITPDKVEVKIDNAHESLEDVITVLNNRINLMMVGPAGSGKTSIAHQAAEALGLEFYAISCGPQTTKTDIMGFVDANGQYRDTMFRKAFEHGGVFLFDEIDASNAAVLTVINAATSNGQAAFPDKIVTRHPDFVVIAAANTFGRGADRQYVGRQQLDAATLDRFVVIEVDYSEAIEKALSGGNIEWLRIVRKIRNAVNDLKIRHVVSPRAIANGSKLLASGLTTKRVLDMVVFKGLDEGQVSQIKAKANIA